MDELVKRCIEYRAANGMSQEEMAARCGVCRETITRFELCRETSRMTRTKISLVINEGGKVDDRA